MAYPRSLMPFMRPNDYWDPWDFPSRIFDQHFAVPVGQVVEEDQGFYPTRTLARPFSRTMSRPRGAGVSEVTNDSTQFQVKLDVAHFAPNEIIVKAIEGNCITIEARHEEKQDEHGYISRQFSRKYLLPKDVETDRIASSLSPEGILTVTAPKKVLELGSGERVVPITFPTQPSVPIQTTQEGMVLSPGPV